MNKEDIRKAYADRLYSELLNRDKKPKMDLTIRKRQKAIPVNTFEVYVKEIGAEEYIWKNTFKTKKDAPPKEFIKDNRKYILVDKDKDTLFYKEITGLVNISSFLLSISKVYIH